MFDLTIDRGPFLSEWFYRRRRRREEQRFQRRIFIDGGSYDGCSARKWLKQNPDYEVYTFEPNPIFAPYHQDLPGTHVAGAVWTHDGTVDFFLDELDYDGSSVFGQKKRIVGGKQIQVPSIDFNKWICQHVGRNDYCVLKLDIEGAEYPVLEHLITEGGAERISELYAEFHWRKLGDAVSRSRHRMLLRRLSKLGLAPRTWNALTDKTLRRWKPEGESLLYSVFGTNLIEWGGVSRHSALA